MLAAILTYLSPKNFKNDTLSGLTVALALVPEAIAFAFVAGVDPIVGLYAAFMVSFLAALFSGRPGMISGATGALAVVMVNLVSDHGVQYLFAAVVLMGLMQMLIGYFKLGKFARIIPHPVMLGFVNGLAIVIFLAQLSQFQTETPEGAWGWLHGTWLESGSMILMLGLVGLTMAIIHFLPKLTKAIPSSLVALVGISAAVIFLDIDTPTVKDMLNGGEIPRNLPSFSIPMVPMTFETLKIIFPYALIITLVGLIESLMTLSLIDEMTDTRGQNNRECLAQGTANIVTGFFGGMGGCAMVGQSMININSNGRGRWSGIVAGIALLLLILFGGNLLELIPLAALVGVMFMVVIGTFEWSSFRIFSKIPRIDAMVLIIVSLTTVFTDLAMAVIIGIVVSALAFVWQKSTKISHTKDFTDKHGAKHYILSGYVFFGSAKNFSELFEVKNDPKEIFIDFADAKILDHSGIEAINSLTKKYQKAGKKLHLQHLSKDCQVLLKNAEGIIEININEDPKYFVADDELA